MHYSTLRRVYFRKSQVNHPFSIDDTAVFKEQSIEVRETAEEAVWQKPRA